MQSMLAQPDPAARATFADGFGPRFLLTVDAEEEFDWASPFDRERHTLAHVPRLGKFQQFCENEGVRPVYLVDYPIASSSIAAQLLRCAVESGHAEVGLQLHPWVNPPHDEEVTARNSFAGNLPRETEAAKIAALRNQVERAFGTAPLIYRAGRYGIGPNTGDILKDQGIAIDTSVRSCFNYSQDDGPNYAFHPLWPYGHDEARELLELPLTTVWSGMLRRQGTWIHPRLWRRPELRGVLARLGLLERIPLTPEGISVDEAVRAIDIALDDGVELLVFSFHSPSLQPGHTPYVQSESDLDTLYGWWRAIFAYLARRGVANASVADIMAAVQR